jgi:hypothetical protein
VLKKVFKAYCRLRVGQGRQLGSSGQQLNGTQFSRMCQDAVISEPTGAGPPAGAPAAGPPAAAPRPQRLA